MQTIIESIQISIKNLEVSDPIKTNNVIVKHTNKAELSARYFDCLPINIKPETTATTSKPDNKKIMC